MATQLSEEETNHLRMSSLLLTIAPRAVRTLFDGIFPPSGLQTVLNMGSALYHMEDQCFILSGFNIR
jgi:hypothetical protein